MAARLSSLLVAAFVVSLLPAAPATASNHSTKVIVSLKVPAFHGKLKSDTSACARDRTVELFRERSGADRLLGTDKSNAKAEWSIRLGKKLTSGSYYAKAPAKGACRTAKSKVLSIG